MKIAYKYDEMGCVCIFHDGSLKHCIQPGSYLLELLIPKSTIIEPYKSKQLTKTKGTIKDRI